MTGTARSTGRVVGALLLVQMAAGVTANFVLLEPLMVAPGGLLTNAAAGALRLSTAVVVGLAGGVISVAIATTAWPILRGYSDRLAVWIVALAVVSLSILAMENIGLLAMLSLSQRYESNSADSNLIQVIATLARALRNWAHYLGLVAGGGTFLIFYVALYRFALVPRALSAFGIAAVVVQMSAVIMPLFGHDVVMWMLIPMGLSHLILALWLGARGFNERSLRRP